MDDKPEKTRPVPGVASGTTRPSAFRRSVPDLFVEDGTKRTAVIGPDEIAGRDPEEIKKAREKRRKKRLVEQLREEADIMSGFRRVRNTVLLVVLIMAGAWIWWEIKQRWSGQWPILLTWFVISAAIMGGFGWALWYIDKGD